MTAPLAPSRALLAWGLALAVAGGCAHAGGSASDVAGGDPMLATEAITAATQEELQANRSTPIEQLLMSRVPGLWAARTADGGLAMRIRGTSSILGSTQPLFVIDGAPVVSGPGGNLVGVNPYDIATVKVLRDPADTAMYGSRGANGVIVITTRQR